MPRRWTVDARRLCFCGRFQSTGTPVIDAANNPQRHKRPAGFRPGRSPRDALDALSVGLIRKKVAWVLDADIQQFYGTLDRHWLRRFLRHRIADKRLLRLIKSMPENCLYGSVRRVPGNWHPYRDPLNPMTIVIP